MSVRRVAHPREAYVTPVDIELLAALEATGSIVEACARISITRDAGMYRLRRLRRAVGSPVVASERGGEDRGGTTLTDAGRRLLMRGSGPIRGAAVGTIPLPVNLLRGSWSPSPQPHVSVDDRVDLYVTFVARAGESVRVAVEPEAIVVARSRFPSSARNVLRGTVESLRRVDGLRSLLHVRVGDATYVDAAITPRSETRLGLKPGTQVFLYLKATAVARMP